MKVNKILIILVVVVAVITAYFMINTQTGTLKGELSNFAVEDTASIDKIFIADKSGNSVTLEKKAPGIWMVNNKFQARNDMLKNLLEVFKKVDVRAPVPQSMMETVIADLATNYQKKVEIYSKGKRIKVFYVGSDSVDHHGTYMLIENSTVPYEMHIPGFRGYLSIRFATDEKLWKTPTIFSYSVQDIRKIRVSYAEYPDESFEVTHDGNGKVSVIELKGGKTLAFDSTAALDYLINFGKISYEAEVKKDLPQKDSILASQPWVIIEVTDHNNEINQVKCFHRAPQEKYSELQQNPKYDPDRMYALTNKGNDFVIVQFYVFNRILVPIEYFMQAPQNQ
jgi:hypothetical protein